jgi:hypothetical protein
VSIKDGVGLRDLDIGHLQAELIRQGVRIH